VAGVADEVPFLLGGGAEAGEHVVEGFAEAVELVVGGRQGEPGGGRGVRDVRGVAAHAVDGAQRGGDDGVAGGGGEQERDRQADEQDAAEGLDGALALAHRGGDGNDGLGPGGAGEDAGALVALERHLAVAGLGQVDGADQGLGALDAHGGEDPAVAGQELRGLSGRVESGAQACRVAGSRHELLRPEAQRVVELVVQAGFDLQVEEGADGGEQQRGGAGEGEGEPEAQREPVQSSHSR